MAKKLVVLSYGHGEDTFPSTGSKGVIVGGKRYAEHTYNAKIGEMTRKIVEAHGIDTLVVQPPNGKDVSLKDRTNKANKSGAQLYYSFHANAGTKTVKGMCAFYWSGSKEGEVLADYYAKLCKEAGLPLYHNGKYASVKGTWNDFHELRETKMVAILSENGFMTNPDDFELIFKNKDNFYEKIAIIHAKVILKYFGVAYKGTTKVTPAKPATKPKTEPKPKVESKQGTVKVLADSLYYYNKPDWNAKAGTVKKNEVFTVVDTLTVKGSKLYKLKSGTYLTANPKYVKFSK